MERSPDTPANTFTVEVDEASGRIDISGVGYWTPSYTEQHFRRVGELVQARRAAGFPIRILVDLRHAQVQSRDTVELMIEGSGRALAEGDNIAIICTSSLGRMQMKRVANTPGCAFFEDLAEGKAWLASRG